MIVRKIIVSTMLAIFLLALTGCSWQSANDQTKNEVFLGKKEAEFRKIGSSDKEGMQVYLFNSTRHEISGIYLRKTGEKTWSKNQIHNKDKIKKDEKVQLNCGSKQVWKYTDIKIKYAKETQTLSKLKLKEVKSIRIYRTKNYAYIEYLDSTKKDFASTKQLEKERFEKAEEKRKAEEIRKAREEEARKQLLEQQKAQATESTQTQTSSQTRSTTSHKKTTSTKRHEENCADSGNEGTYVDDGNGGWKWVPN